MVSKVAIAAGLLGSVLAQSNATVTVDVYASVTTITETCSACTAAPSGGANVDGTITVAAGPVVYTVVVNNGQTTLVGSGAPPSATSASTNSACGFALAVNGTTTLQQIADGQIQVQDAPGTLGQIPDGQVQSASGLTSSTFTISNGMVYDQVGRICSISGDNQAQFQCNYVPTIGSTTTTFSLSGMNLAFNGDTTFYACLLGGPNDGYNIYKTLTGVQNQCSPVVLTAIGNTDCAAGTPAQTTAVAGPPGVTPAPSVPGGTQPANTVPVVTSLPTASPNAASSVSSHSVVGLLVAAAFSYMLL